MECTYSQGKDYQPNQNPIFLDTESGIAELINHIVASPPCNCLLFVDIAGERLSRDGTISLLQILLFPSNTIYMIDVHKLGFTAFSVNGYAGWTLKQVLEAPQIVKVFFDVRNDSAALHACYNIKLDGVRDLQLMELAACSSKKYVHGLRHCIEQSCRITGEQKNGWVKNHVQGLNLFVPAWGGMFDIFNARPLNHEILSFCAQQVYYLPLLWQEYNFVLSSEWQDCASYSARQRVIASQDANFKGIGKHMAFGPYGWW